MSVKLLTEHHLKFLSLNRGNTGLSESALVKMPHCLKSNVVAHKFFGLAHKILVLIAGVWNSKTFYLSKDK